MVTRSGFWTGSGTPLPNGRRWQLLPPRRQPGTGWELPVGFQRLLGALVFPVDLVRAVHVAWGREPRPIMWSGVVACQSSEEQMLTAEVGPSSILTELLSKGWLLVGRYPWRVIGVFFMWALLSGAGFSQLNIEGRNDPFWSPTDSDAFRDFNLEEKFHESKAKVIYVLWEAKQGISLIQRT